MATTNQLRRSKYSRDGKRKTCPHCSLREGRFIYKSMESFGERVDDKSGKVIPQSWCYACRSNKNAGE